MENMIRESSRSAGRAAPETSERATDGCPPRAGEPRDAVPRCASSVENMRVIVSLEVSPLRTRVAKVTKASLHGQPFGKVQQAHSLLFPPVGGPVQRLPVLCSPEFS